MNFNQLIQDISFRFLEAWDERDFLKLRTLLASNIVFESPNITELFPDNIDGTIYGIDHAMDYLQKLATMAPDFRFDRDKSVFNKADRTIVMHGVMSQNGKLLIAKYQLNEYGKFSSIHISYPDGFM